MSEGMNEFSLQTSKSNGWNSGNSVGHLTMPLRSLAMGKEVTVDVPATNVSGLSWMGSASENKDPKAPRGYPHSLQGLGHSEWGLLF